MYKYNKDSRIELCYQFLAVEPHFLMVMASLKGLFLAKKKKKKSKELVRSGHAHPPLLNILHAYNLFVQYNTSSDGPGSTERSIPMKN